MEIVNKTFENAALPSFTLLWMKNELICNLNTLYKNKATGYSTQPGVRSISSVRPASKLLYCRSTKIPANILGALKFRLDVCGGEVYKIW